MVVFLKFLCATSNTGMVVFLQFHMVPLKFLGLFNQIDARVVFITHLPHEVCSVLFCWWNGIDHCHETFIAVYQHHIFLEPF